VQGICIDNIITLWLMHPLQRTTTLFWKYWRRAIVMYFCLLAGVGLALVIPSLTGHAINLALGTKQTASNRKVMIPVFHHSVRIIILLRESGINDFKVPWYKRYPVSEDCHFQSSIITPVPPRCCRYYLPIAASHRRQNNRNC